MSACRARLTGVLDEPARVAHAGLLLSRFLRVPVGQKAHPDERRRLLDLAARHALPAAREVYAAACDRRRRLLEQEQARVATLAVRGRLVIGLGNSGPLETGITLHHTYGTPVIPGSALKGLAAHYCDQVWGTAGADSAEFRRRVEIDTDGRKTTRAGEFFEILFGTTGDAGRMTFHDAWIDADCLGSEREGLVPDVMTPHHGEYYSGAARDGERAAPTDFDDPNPIAFLSVAGRFQVALSCDDPSETGRAWRDRAFELLTAALADWGVGGKTSSGYGRMAEPAAAAPRSPGDGKGQPPPPVPLPTAGQRVGAVLLHEKTRGGGWKARHTATGISGPIQNTADVPADKQPGDPVTLIVKYANPREIGFRYPTVADEDRGTPQPRGRTSPRRGR